jgi:pyridoxamine 5'-phosphate oxidase
MNLADLRISYTKAGLIESEMHDDPIQQFALWFDQAIQVSGDEPNAMALATVSADGQPNCRMVLLKSFDGDGFVFYTNYSSRKGDELDANPRATLLFYWPDLERQVRIGGVVERVSREESERYFHSRPEGHRLGAWASRQSAVVESRDALERAMADAAKRFAADAPCPPFWGGYRVRPHVFEFWQGRENRLHDRIEYVQTSAGDWMFRRLAP